MNLGQKAEEYLKELAQISEEGPGVTRLFLTNEHKEASVLIKAWMSEVGLESSMDQFGNVIGEYDCGNPKAKTLIFGSHQDSVINGGMYDGMLGIVAPIIALGELEIDKLNFNLKLLAFSDEEGVRFGTTYLGSKAITGNISKSTLLIEDANGIKLETALKEFGLQVDKINECVFTKSNLDYIEVHIEQGTILESNNQALGVVNGIQASKRFEFTITGHAGHAGNLPMDLRHDASVTMAKIMVYINELAKMKEKLVATVGKIALKPNAINVVPGQAVFSLDIRSPEKAIIEESFESILDRLDNICQNDHTIYHYKTIAESSGVGFNEKMTNRIASALKKSGNEVPYIYSGAGHDAQEMSKIANAGMMFVRCKNGISHHPDEYVSPADLEKTVKAIIQFIKDY